MKRFFYPFPKVFFALLFMFSVTLARSGEIPVKGTVTLFDLGASSCVPCKMMAPILEKLEREYSGRAAIIFIDVWKNVKEARKYGIRSIPTQILYDASGKERYRHTGFWSELEIKEMLDLLLEP